MRNGARRTLLAAALAAALRPEVAAAEARFAVWQCGALPEGAVTCRRIVADTPADSVFSVDLVLSYLPADATLGTIQKGSWAQTMSFQANTTTPGQVRLGLAGGTALGGSGDLLLVPFMDSPDVQLRIESVSVNEGGLVASFGDNAAPVLSPVADQTVAHGQTLSVDLQADDADLPRQPLTFHLVSGPTGVTLDTSTGRLTWTPAPDQPADDYAVSVKVTDAGEPPLESATSFTVHLNASVVGRHLFYNQSFGDGSDPAASAADDAAIAPDKEPLLPGGSATFANYSSYHRGINGLMVDIAGLPGLPVAADLQFKTGNDANPENWEPAPAPTIIAVRPGAGTGGSDRVTLIWESGAVAKAWLQVSVLATASTGLAQNDVFYFGNAVGETGDEDGNANVGINDALRILYHLNPNADVDSALDIDRGGSVGINDALLVLYNLVSGAQALQWIALAAAPALNDAGRVEQVLYLNQRALLHTGSDSLQQRIPHLICVERVGLDRRRFTLSIPRHAAVSVSAAHALSSPVWESVPQDLITFPFPGVAQFALPARDSAPSLFLRIEADVNQPVLQTTTPFAHEP